MTGTREEGRLDLAVIPQRRRPLPATQPLPAALELVGHRFSLLGPAAAVQAILRWTARTETREPKHIHLVNAYTVALADRDRRLAGVLREGVNFIDGTPLAWLAARVGGIGRRGQACRGPQLFHDVLEAGSQQGTRHYLLGGSPETLEALRRRIAAEHPHAVIAGAVSPPFRPISEQEKAQLLDDIRAADADIVWVGLGTPRQDFEAREICTTLGVTTVAIGAAFDFAAGMKREAPRWLRGTGLEWVHRLATEPRRLWRRYLFGNSRFLYLAAVQLASAPRRPRAA